MPDTGVWVFLSTAFLQYLLAKLMRPNRAAASLIQGLRTTQRAHTRHTHTHTYIYTHTHAHTLHRHISLGFRTHTQSITNASKGRPLPTSSFRDVFSPSTMRDQILHLAEEKLVGNLHIGTHLSSVCRDVSTLKNQCQQLCCTSNAFS